MRFFEDYVLLQSQTYGITVNVTRTVYSTVKKPMQQIYTENVNRK